jgi:Na+-transporting NADH:ubiquinone oxidoreductase subunit B/electron transport complex protein RnfD
MKNLKLRYDKLVKIGVLRHFRIITQTIDGILFGTSKITAGAPHFVDSIDIKRFMSAAIIALVPSAAASIYFFGLQAIKIIVVSYVAGGIVEVLFAFIRKKEIEEGFLVTGLIFPLTLPPSTPLWVVAVGVIFGTIFGKELFGGTGRNIFNPALVGRLFITIGFPEIMTTSWVLPLSHAVTSATPLVVYKSSQTIPAFLNLLLGTTAGSMGETFRIGIILGGLFLMFSRVSNWRIPITYLLSVFILSWIGNTFLPEKIAPPLFQILSGGLLFGAMFMATDPVTSPYTKTGKLIFGIMAGLFTVLIRAFSGFTEGVMFSIVLMNGFTPLIDHIVITFKYRPEKNER